MYDNGHSREIVYFPTSSATNHKKKEKRSLNFKLDFSLDVFLENTLYFLLKGSMIAALAWVIFILTICLIYRFF